MKRTLFVGMLAVALAVTPAFAAKKKSPSKAAPKRVIKKSMADLEREAWGETKTVVKKPAVKKAKSAAKKDELKPTVTLSGNAKKKPIAKKGEPKPQTSKPEEVKKPETVASAATDEAKTAEELEKEAKAQKDPKKAIETYGKLLEKNPNYAYSGDVYKDMYNLSVQSKADTLTQLTFAGKAAQGMEQGRTRGPVNPQELNRLNRATDDLINRWIEETTKKIMEDARNRQ